MSIKEFNADNLDELLPYIANYIEMKVENKKSFCKEIGMARSSFYEFLYKDSKDLERIQRILSTIGIKISIKLAKK